MAFTWHAKIKKAKGTKPTQVEELVAQYLFDLQAHSEFKADLEALHITAVKEVTPTSGPSALVIFVPYRLLSSVRKVQAHLVEELEKKTGKHVFVLAQRRILAAPSKAGNTKKLQKRPRSRTLTAVHESILDDLVYPAEVSDKRIRIKVDGSRSSRVYGLFLIFLKNNNFSFSTLEAKDSVEHKLDSYSAVYKKLTGKDVTFLFPQAKAEAQ